MIWESVIGQEEVVSQLKRAIENDEISHAYLFLGTAGAGQKTAAKAFASAVNCLKAGCGVCNTCGKIQNDIHPDVVYVEPEGNFFTIGQVRELQQEIYLKSFEATTKFFILDEVDRMTVEAANSLLRTLEEPPPRIVFVLLTANLDSLLSTIISRCRLVRFRPISSSILVDLLVSRYGIGEDDAELFARLSGGVLTRAQQYAESDQGLQLRRSVHGIIENVSNWDGLDLTNAAEQIVKEIKKPLEDLKKGQKEKLDEIVELAVDSAHAHRLETILDRKHKRRLNREERDRYHQMLSFFQSWYRDVMVLKEACNPSLLVNIDCQDRLEEDALQISCAKARDAIEAVQRAEERLRSNVNPQLAMESMLLELRSYSHKS